MTLPLLLTEDDAARLLLMHPRTLRKLRQAGEIRYVALAGRKIAYRPEDCHAYIESNLRLAEPAPRPRARRSVANRHVGNIVPFTARQGARR